MTALPFGDPCPRCCAASVNPDPHDRICDCAPCEVCGVPTGYTCAVCGRSLGCGLHAVSIEWHIETYCLAGSLERHKELAACTNEQMAAVRDELRATTPKPWPAPVPPRPMSFDDINEALRRIREQAIAGGKAKA